MDSKLNFNQRRLMRELLNVITDDFQEGKSRAAIIEKLIEQGINPEVAGGMANEVYAEIIRMKKNEVMNKKVLRNAILGGIVAIVFGGILWKVIYSIFEYESPIMPALVGAICGYSILIFTNGKRGKSVQAMAILSTLLAMLFGKYLVFLPYFNVDNKSYTPLVIQESIRDFFWNLGFLVTWFDIVWVILASLVAWIILKPTKLRLPTG